MIKFHHFPYGKLTVRPSGTDLPSPAKKKQDRQRKPVRLTFFAYPFFRLWNTDLGYWILIGSPFAKTALI